MPVLDFVADHPIFTILAVLIVIWMLASAMTPPPTNMTLKTPQQITGAQQTRQKDDAKLKLAIEGAATLRDAARNPDSFKFSQVLAMEDGTVCFTYRAQNGFGGMNIENAVVLPSEKLITSDASGFTAMWNKECRGKTGDDRTKEIAFIAEHLTH